MVGLSPGELAIEIAQLALIGVGGAWALYNYRRFRRGQAKISLEPSIRLHHEIQRGQSVLFVRLRLTNTSSVLFRYQQASATLLDASGRTPDNKGDLAGPVR